VYVCVGRTHGGVKNSTNSNVTESMEATATGSYHSATSCAPSFPLPHTVFIESIYIYDDELFVN